MFYPSDFKTFSPFQPRFNYKRSVNFARKKPIRIDQIAPENGEIEEDSKQSVCCETFIKWFENFCANTSIHGMKFIGNQNLHLIDRIFWAVLVCLAVSFIISITISLSNKFYESPLSTVVESTIFPVAEIPYPSITICASNRFNAERVEKSIEKFIPNADNDTIRIFRILMLSMNSYEFGAFDDFYDDVFEFSSEILDRVNLTAVFEYSMLTCEELFIGRCWWRNRYYNCCNDFMYVVKSEYSLCYGFNSAVTDLGIEKDANTSVHYPLRTSNYGDWSGLRIELSTRTDIALLEKFDGALVIISHPDQWPNSAYFVPGKSQTSFVIKPTYSYTTDDVRKLRPEQRQCLNVSKSNSYQNSILHTLLSLHKTNRKINIYFDFLSHSYTQ